MKFTQRARGLVQAIAVVLALAVPLAAAISPADARIGGGFSSGSRGARTFSAPPSTSTAPSTAQPFNRTITQPNSPGFGVAGWRFLQPARPWPARRACRRLPRRRPVRHAVRRRPVRRHRRIVVDLRPDDADRPDRLRGPDGDVVVAAPSRRPMPVRAGRRSRCADDFRAGTGFGLGIRQRAARNRACRLRSLRAAARRYSGRVVERGCRQTAHAGDAGDGRRISRNDLEAKPRAQRRQQGVRHSSCCRAISPKPGAKAIPNMPASRCGSRWSTRPSTAPPAGWSKAASSRRKPPKSGPSCGRAAPTGSFRRSSRQLIVAEPDQAKRRGSYRGAFSFQRCRTGIISGRMGWGDGSSAIREPSPERKFGGIRCAFSPAHSRQHVLASRRTEP